MPTKVIVTAEATMKKKYGSGWPGIRKAIDRLVTADAKRGVTTTFVALDGAALKKHKAIPGKPATFKDAVDHVWGLQKQPDYMLILGGPDVVPHQSLRNPVPDDDDADVPSDLPYACAEPATDEIERLIAPARVIGRIPDVGGKPKAADLVALLDAAAAWKPKPKSAYRDYFGLSAFKWKRSTDLSLKALFGANARARTSPLEGPGWKKADVAALSHFINCHGATTDPQFYGERDGDFPIAHQAIVLPKKIGKGTVVAAECCFGAEVYLPSDTVVPGICMHYLKEGAVGFLGSTNVAYGPSASNASADLICRFFLESVLKGATLGRALLEARLRFVQEESPLNPVELKTIAQFVLLGDPSLRAVQAPGKVKTGTKSFAASARAHGLRRGNLGSKAAMLSKGTDQVDSQPTGASSPAIRAQLESAARQEGFIPETSSKAYRVRQADDPASRLALSKKTFSTTRFHVLVARQPTGGQPKSGGKALAAGPSRRREAGKRARPRRVSDKMVLVAREVGGKVEAVERLFAHRRATITMNERFEGRVVKKRVARASKSDHQAVVLETGEDDLLLRREGGNAFRDPVLEELVGHRIRGTGRRSGSTLILSDWEEIEPGNS